MIPLVDKSDRLSVAPITSVTGANPAANAECSITVPAGERWLLLAFTVANVQGGTGTPHPKLQIDDGTNVLFQAHAGTAAQAISTTCQFSWVAGGAAIGPTGLTTAVAAQGGLPEGLVLEAGYKITTVTAGLSATTDYGVPRATVVKL